MDNLQVILLEESEFADHNYELMQSALEYWNTYLIDKNDELFLTVDSLITLNNISLTIVSFLLMLAFAAVKYFYLLHFSLQNKKMAFLKEEFKSRTKLDKFKIKKKNFIFLDYG